MPKSEKFRVNYYVGAMLAQGGQIWLEDSKIVFSPTSALDRAMGAKDVEIPFNQIQDLNFKGDLLRTFTIQTKEKRHKFEGSQVRKVWELIDKALKIDNVSDVLKSVTSSHHQTSTPAASPPPVLISCDACATPLEPGYSFCPSCGTRPKSICASCRKTIMSNWKTCAFCGSKFSTGGTKN